MKLIPLTQGLFAQVDDEDYERVSQFSWYAHRLGQRVYALRSLRRPNGTRTTQAMHVFIMGTPLGFDTHHRSGSGLDNLKKNLQVVSKSQHGQLEYRRRAQNKSGFRGVHFDKRREHFAAQVRIGGRSIHISCHDTAEDAARARDAKARELGWPEASMNFPL